MYQILHFLVFYYISHFIKMKSQPKKFLKKIIIILILFLKKLKFKKSKLKNIAKKVLTIIQDYYNKKD